MLVNLEGPPLRSLEVLPSRQRHFLKINKGKGSRLILLNGALAMESLVAYKTKRFVLTNAPPPMFTHGPYFLDLMAPWPPFFKTCNEHCRRIPSPCFFNTQTDLFQILTFDFNIHV